MAVARRYALQEPLYPPPPPSSEPVTNLSWDIGQLPEGMVKPWKTTKSQEQGRWLLQDPGSPTWLGYRGRNMKLGSLLLDSVTEVSYQCELMMPIWCTPTCQPSSSHSKLSEPAQNPKQTGTSARLPNPGRGQGPCQPWSNSFGKSSQPYSQDPTQSLYKPRFGKSWPWLIPKARTWSG